MSQYKKSFVGVSKIKTDHYQPENSKEFLFTLGVLLKTILPLGSVVVHKGTMQLIANGQYLQLAIEEGKDQIEVVMADFPEAELLHAVATHWKPTKKFAAMYKVIPTFMKYYSLKNGPGAKYREGMSDLTLRELVAEILGTNKTYLDMVEAIGDYKRQLLEHVDAGMVSLHEAFAMVPKTTIKKKKGGSENTAGDDQPEMKNYTVPVKEITGLSNEELDTLTTNLPSWQAEEIGNGILPEGLSISKCFTYNDTFQGFVLVYEKSEKSIIIHISYTDELKSALLKAA